MSTVKHPLPKGHVLMPAVAIGSLSLVLAVGLRLLGISGRLDDRVAGLITGGGMQYPKSLPETLPWLAAAVFAFGLAFAILAVGGTWRRVVVWITALVLIAGWAPVLVLAARTPDIATPFVVAFWTGICALVYAGNHRMESDRELNPRPTAPVQVTHETR